MNVLPQSDSVIDLDPIFVFRIFLMHSNIKVISSEL